MNKNNNEKFYRENGIAIYYKGIMVVGIHPDNVDNNIKALDEGNLKINWSDFETIHQSNKTNKLNEQK